MRSHLYCFDRYDREHNSAVVVVIPLNIPESILTTRHQQSPNQAHQEDRSDCRTGHQVRSQKVRRSSGHQVIRSSSHQVRRSEDQRSEVRTQNSAVRTHQLRTQKSELRRSEVSKSASQKIFSSASQKSEVRSQKIKSGNPFA